MKIRSLIPIATFASLLLVSCKSYPPETQKLLSQIEQQNSQILRQEAMLSNAKLETRYLQEKNEVLKHEKQACQETLAAVSSSVRSVFWAWNKPCRTEAKTCMTVSFEMPCGRQKALECAEDLLLSTCQIPPG